MLARCTLRWRPFHWELAAGNGITTLRRMGSESPQSPTDARSPQFNALRGVAKLWLRAHQAQQAKRLENCPTVNIDLNARRVRFGNALADRWQAEVIALAGIWVPHQQLYVPAMLDPDCPPFLTDRLKWCLEKPPLSELPEASQPEWTGCTEDDAWTWAGLLGEGAAAGSVQVSPAGPGAVFLLIEEIQPIPASQRKFTPEYLRSRVKLMAMPVVHAFSQALSRPDETGAEESKEDEAIDLSAALQSADQLVETLRASAEELSSEAPELASHLLGPAGDLSRALDQISSAFNSGDGGAAADGLAELSVILSVMVPDLTSTS